MNSGEVIDPWTSLVALKSMSHDSNHLLPDFSTIERGLVVDLLGANQSLVISVTFRLRANVTIPDPIPFKVTLNYTSGGKTHLTQKSYINGFNIS